jgi:hypothetical protein
MGSFSARGQVSSGMTLIVRVLLNSSIDKTAAKSDLCAIPSTRLSFLEKIYDLNGKVLQNRAFAGGLIAAYDNGSRGRHRISKNYYQGHIVGRHS